MNEDDTLDKETPQELLRDLRQHRKDVDGIRKLLDGFDKDLLSTIELKSIYYAAKRKAREARFQLGYALERVGSPSPYEEIDNSYKARRDTVRPKPEADTVTLDNTDYSPEERLLEVRERGESVYKSLEDIRGRSRIHKTMFYQYLEQAILYTREVRSHAGVLYSTHS
jgi:hypothetical protein